MADDDPSDDPARRRVHHEFDSSYVEGTPPWDIGRPQPEFVRLAEGGEIRGRVLDVGCGTGEHALMAAAMGLESTGVDTAPTAIERAKEKAAQRSLSVRFEVWDALDLPALGEQFDTVLDCGLFHTLSDDQRGELVTGLRAVLAADGRLFILCFSEKQPGDWGPRRIRADELRACFSDGWRTDSIEDATLDITLDPAGARAWLASFTRI